MSSSSTSLIAVDALTLPLKANTVYRAVGTYVWSSPATTTGAGFAFNVFTAPALFASTCATNTVQNAVSTPTFANSRVPNIASAVSTVDTAAATMLATCTALVKTNSSANLATKIKTSTSGVPVTILAGSMVELEELPPN